MREKRSKDKGWSELASTLSWREERYSGYQALSGQYLQGDYQKRRQIAQIEVRVEVAGDFG
jgi:hypothetical protein